MNKVEILAPAGNYEAFVSACNAGADAIYMGVGKHNARMMTKNFTEEEYIKALDYAHLRGIKVYLTLNTLIYDDEIKEALELVLKLYSYGLDAVIVQDIGISRLIHKLLPSLSIHASTQMSVYSLEQVEFLKSIGFKRVVLARELTLSEIENICKNVDIEIEVFVHGALCVCVSGQCLLSQSIGQRSANRGSCAQPCRMKYTLLNSKDESIVKDSYILSKKDIYGLDNIKKFVNSGITSLKIEGRNKSAEYVGLVVSRYRKYVDKYYNNEDTIVEKQDEKDVMQIFNRSGKSFGYLNGIEYKKSITDISPKNTGLFLGKVISQNKLFIKVKLEENIDLHDGIEIYDGKNIVSTLVTCIKSENGSIINSEAKKGDIILIGDIQKKVNINSLVYKTSSYTLNYNINKKYVKTNLRRRKIHLDISILNDCNVKIRAYDDCNLNENFEILYIPQKALKKALSKEDIINSFSKTLDTAFEFNIQNINLDDNLFIPVSKLNEFRKDVVNKLENIFVIRNDIENIDIESVLKTYEKDIKKIDNLHINSLFLYSYDNNIDYTKEYNFDRLDINILDFLKYEDDIFKKYLAKTKLCIYIPNFVLKNLDKYIKENLRRIILRGIDTVILSSFSYYNLLNSIKSEKNFNLVSDYSFNISNKYSALFMKELGFDAIVPSFDANNIYEFAKYIKLEIQKDYMCVMTSRYCILGAFVADRKNKCSMPCTKDKYYLKDSFGEKYYILCDNVDCIMRIIKKNKNLNIDSNKVYTIRKAII